MSASVVVQDLLEVLKAAGDAVKVLCPGCGAAVDLAELLAAQLASTQTEAGQVAAAEEAILAADAALTGAHASPAPAPAASAPPAVVVPAPPAAVTAVAEEKPAAPAGTVAAWPK